MTKSAEGNSRSTVITSYSIHYTKLYELLSTGGFVPDIGGEIITTYRLLLNNESDAEFTEQALGFTYNRQFDGWLRDISHTLSYFKYQEQASAEALKNGNKWHNNILLSTGNDLDMPFLGLIKGYRVDFSYKLENTLLRSTAKETRRNSAVGTHLKIKTDLGTFFGKMQQSDITRKLTFGLQKKGWADAQFKLYVEELTPLTSGYVETRVGGQLHMPIEGALLDVFNFDFWKVAEGNLFAPIRRWGYLTPNRSYNFV